MRKDRYYCSARREKGTCDSDRGIAVQELEDRVLAGMKELLIGNEELMEVFVDEFKAEIKRLHGERHQRIRPLQKELQKIERGIRRCLDFITGGDGDPRLVAPELTTLEQRKMDIEAQLNAAEPDDNIELHPNMAELYRKKVEDLQDILLDEVTRPEAIDIFRSLIERIEINQGNKRGACDVVLFGALASVLAFLQQKTTAASGRDDGTFLMVAGVGFEPTTFRL